MADNHIHNLLFALGVVFATVLMLADRPAHAQAVMQSDLDRCMAIRDVPGRLACFETLATRSGPASSTSTIMSEPKAFTRKAGDTASGHTPETAPVSASAPPPAPALTSKTQRMATPSSASVQSDDDFGLPEKPAPKDRADRTRELVLASATRNRRGYIVMTMQNGQIWRQTDKAPIIVPSSGDQAVIEEGFPAGYRMRLNKRTIRVERLK